MLRSAWNQTPIQIQAGLACGSFGPERLFALARTALASGGPDLARDFVAAAWEEAPLLPPPPDLAALLEGEGGLSTLVRQMAGHYRPPGDLRYLNRLEAGSDKDKRRAHLEAMSRKDPDNLFWTARAAGSCLSDPDHDPAWAERFVLAPLSRAPKPLLDYYQAGLLLRRNDLERAAAIFRTMADSPLSWTAGLGLARALDQSGREEALPILAGLLKSRPWRSELILALHDRLKGFDKSADRLAEKPVVLVPAHPLSKNLDRFLALLAGNSGIGFIAVLTQAGSPGCGRVAAAWAERLGPERFRHESPPTDIGSPAGKNWLLNLAQARSNRFAVISDGRFAPPPDWLERLAQARALYPGAGVWGLGVKGSPRIPAEADKHLFPESGNAAYDPALAHGRRFSLREAGPDGFGLWPRGYIRPCASTSPGLRLYETEVLRECGGFSLHLSPGGREEMELDLKRLLDGSFVGFQGFSRLEPDEAPAGSAPASKAEQGNELGDRYKIQSRFTLEEREKMLDFQSDLLRGDLLRKMDFLDRRPEFKLRPDSKSRKARNQCT